MTLTLTRWPSYTNLTSIPRRCISCVKINFICQGFWKFSHYSLWMRALSYVWSLLVMWQRRWPHHSIHHRQKPHVQTKFMALCFIEPELVPWKFYIAGINIFNGFAPVALTMTRRPSYTNVTRIPWIHTACANMNFSRWEYQQLSSDTQTDRQTDTTEII